MNNTLLNNKTIKELREVAKELGLKGVSRLTKEDMIQAILGKITEQNEIVNNIAEVHKLAKDIVEQESTGVWKKMKGEYACEIIMRNIAKLGATTPVAYAKDSRLDRDDFVYIKLNGKNIKTTVANLMFKASKVNEEESVKAKQQTIAYNNEREKEILAELNAEAKARQEAKEEAIELQKSAKDREKEVMEQMVEEICENQALTTKDNEDKLAQLTLVAELFFTQILDTINKQNATYGKAYAELIEAKNSKDKDLIKLVSEKLNVITKNKKSFVTLVNEKAEILSCIIDNSFSKDDLVTKDNFEKRTEFDALIDAVLIRSDMFDYKVKDEFTSSLEVADFLLAEARHINIVRDLNYHARMIKTDEPFAVKTTQDGKEYQALYQVTENQLKKIAKIRMNYYRTHKNFPALPVEKLEDITSSTLANAIIKKYMEYAEMDAPISDNQAEYLFNLFCKWGLGTEDNRLAFIRNAKLNYSTKQASTIYEISKTDMWLCKMYKEDKKLSIMDACLELASFTEQTRVLLKRKYTNKFDNYRMKLFNVEDELYIDRR